MKIMDEIRLVAFLHQQGYNPIRKLPNGQLIGVAQQAFTYGLFFNLTEEAYSGRYCYEYEKDALEALCAWDGEGDPPGPWIKVKGLEVQERLGPGAM